MTLVGQAFLPASGMPGRQECLPHQEEPNKPQTTGDLTMSTKIHDLAAGAVLGASVVPQVATASQDGESIDLIEGDGNAFAVLMVGTVVGGTTVGGKVQESADESVWDDVDGAVFPNVTESDGAFALTFVRSRRYARCVVTLTGGSPQAAVAAMIGQQKKLM
jgi:hypothetical protein